MNERANYMAGIAEKALSPMVESDDARFTRMIERAPWGWCSCGALELSLPHRLQYHRPRR